MAKKTSKYIKSIITDAKKAFYFIGFFSFFVNILMLTVPLYMLQIYDRVLASYSYETLIYLTLIAVVALSVYGLLEMVRTRILTYISSWLDGRLGPEALARTADSLLSGQGYGTQALRDINSIRQFIGGQGVVALFDSPWVPIYLSVIYLISPYLGILATVGAIILFSLAIINQLLTGKFLAEANAKSINAQKHIDATVRNAEVIQAMGMMQNIVEHWQRHNAPVMGLQQYAGMRSGMIVAISKFFRLTLQILMLGTGAFLVLQHHITGGAMIAGFILLSRALAPVEISISQWRFIIAAFDAYKRLNKYFLTETRKTTELKLPKPKGELNLEGVVYIPPGTKKPIINNVNLNIKAGSMVAVIGPSGAGKSTLARLITGAWPATMGKVRLDGADVYTWERTDFGKYVGYLPQDIELFSGTIKSNIARMGDIDDHAVIKAAQAAFVHEIILHFPHGYDSEIDVGRFTLSGGQRQRIAFARALYQDPQLIVLDEPNSNLDAEGEQALVTTLLALKARGATVILITHKQSILKVVDEIVMIKEGRIQFVGPRDKILESLKEVARTKKTDEQTYAATPYKLTSDKGKP